MRTIVVSVERGGWVAANFSSKDLAMAGGATGGIDSRKERRDIGEDVAPQEEGEADIA